MKSKEIVKLAYIEISFKRRRSKKSIITRKLKGWLKDE